MLAAPVLSGTAGTLIAVLDAVLVNGFGLQTASSVVVAGGIATATYGAAHSFVPGSVALFAGATPSSLNGEQRILTTTTLTATFTTTAADGAATGTLTSKVAPAGWSKVFAGTNLAAYKITSVLGTGCVLRVDDTGTTTARVRGYETMSDVNTGVGPFPSVAQQAQPGLWWTKSDTASATPRPWRIAADDRGFFYFVKNAVYSEHQGNYFGDLIPIKSNDPYACILKAQDANSSSSTSAIQQSLEWADSSMICSGLYAARAANTLGGAAQHYQCPVTSVGLLFQHCTGSVGFPYPSPVDNGLMLTPVAIYNSSGYRGYHPGLMFSPQITNAAFNTGDTVVGSGAMVGKTVSVIKMGAINPGGGQGVVFVDTVSDWR